MTEFVKFIRPDGEVEYRNKDYDEIVSQPVIPPTEYVVIPEEELRKWEYTQYQRLRSPEYPPITEQLDALWKGGEAAEEMLQKIQEVKNRYPKPEVK